MSILVERASDVRINEFDVSQVLTSSSLTQAAQIVVSKKGRSDEPVHFTDGTVYLHSFGNPDAQVSFDVYCGIDYFREGNDLWALRVVGAGARYSAVVLAQAADGTTGLYPVPAGVEDPEFVDLDDLVPSSVVPLALFYPSHGQGSYGNDLAVSITAVNVPRVSNLTAAATSGLGILGPGTYTYQVSALGESGETLASDAVQVVIATALPADHVIDLEWPTIPNAVGYVVYGRMDGSGYGRMTQVGQVNTATVTFTDTGAITPDITREPITDPADLPPASPEFIVNFYDTTRSRTVAIESFNSTLIPFTDGDGISTELEDRINPFSQLMQVRSNAPALPSPETVAVTAVSTTNLAGGDSGAAPTSFDVARAWGVFSNKEVYQINTLINSGHSTPEVGFAMEELARGRGDSIALLDTPSTRQQYMQAVNYRNLDLNLNSSYAALFCPDVLESDNINGKQLYVPFSGWAAALCARTARVANQSFSVAGLNRGLLNVLKQRYTYDDSQASVLFRAQVNYARTFLGQGIALWEQQTLQAKKSALSWMSVRILTNAIKVALYRFGLYVIQEPNDEMTQRQLVISFSDYLDSWKNARGLHDFRVIVDASNNTAAMANSGILRASVILIPVIPIHELQVDVIISKQGISFTETVRDLYGS